MSDVSVRLLERAAAGWQALVDADPNATPAHRPEFWETWCAVTPGCRPGFVAVERAGELIGGAPLVIERRVGLHWIHALPQLLPGAPLARLGAAETVDRAVGEAIGRLQAELGAVGGEWSLYRPAPGGVRSEDAARVAGESRVHETWLVTLGRGVAAVERGFEPDVRMALRRGRETLKFAEEPEAIEAVHALHRAQSRGWGAHRPIPLELARRLLAAGGGAPAARVFTVRDARRLLAGIYFLDHPRELFAWWSGSHPEAAERHAMSYLYAEAALWAEASGRARLNLGGTGGVGGLAAFKRSLGGRALEYRVVWLDSAGGVPARVFRALQDGARRGRFRGEPA